MAGRLFAAAKTLASSRSVRAQAGSYPYPTRMSRVGAAARGWNGTVVGPDRGLLVRGDHEVGFPQALPGPGVWVEDPEALASRVGPADTRGMIHEPGPPGPDGVLESHRQINVLEMSAACPGDNLGDHIGSMRARRGHTQAGRHLTSLARALTATMTSEG